MKSAKKAGGIAAKKEAQQQAAAQVTQNVSVPKDDQVRDKFAAATKTIDDFSLGQGKLKGRDGRPIPAAEKEAQLNRAFADMNEIIQQDIGKDCAHAYFQRGRYYMEYFKDYKRALYDFSAAVIHKTKQP